MKWRILLLSIFISFFSVKAFQINDPLHGFSVNVPDTYGVSASSKTGKIIIMSQDYKKGVSVFALKNPKSKDPTYFLNILALPIKNYGKVFYKKEKNKVVAKIEAPYWTFGEFFNSDFMQGIFLQNIAGLNAKGIVTAIRGKKYSLLSVLIYQNSEDLKELKSILSSLKLKKPTVKYKNQTIMSNLHRIPAMYVDLPSGFTIQNTFYVATQTLTEVPAVLIKSSTEGIYLGIVLFQYLYSPDPLMPFFNAGVSNPFTGQPMPVQTIFQSNEEFIKFIVSQISNLQNFSIKYVSTLTYPMTDFSYQIYRLDSQTLFGSAWIGRKDLNLGNAYSGNWTGIFKIAWGKDLNKAVGTLISFEIDPKWFSRNIKVTIQEARKEIEHRRWIWNEFRKTQDYIRKLHQQDIKEEQIYQEEMARAMTNILSDYTYARDPETGEVFHLKDDFDQYWRTEEGEIFGISGEVDERLLEAQGFKKLQIRLEGFGQW